MANVLYSDEPLIIDLTSDAVQEVLSEEMKQAFSGLGIETLQIKNFFNLVNVDGAGMAFRTMLQLKLPEQIWQNGYLNMLNQKEEWVPIYCSSGKNSGHKGRWHPYIGAIKLNQPKTNIYQNLRDYYVKILRNKDRDLADRINQLITTNEIFVWFVKCRTKKMLNSRTRAMIANTDDENKLTKLRELRGRFHRIYENLFTEKATLNYNSPSSKSEQAYVCNNFFKLMNDTLGLLLTTSPDAFTLVGQEPVPITSVTNKIEYFMNQVLGSNNIFGLPLFLETDSPYISELLAALQNQENRDFVIEYTKKNWSWNDSQANNWYDFLVEYLQDSLRIKPLELLLDQIINNETFIQSLEAPSSGNGETKNVIGGGKRKTRKRKNKRKHIRRVKRKTRRKQSKSKRKKTKKKRRKIH